MGRKKQKKGNIFQDFPPECSSATSLHLPEVVCLRNFYFQQRVDDSSGSLVIAKKKAKGACDRMIEHIKQAVMGFAA